VQYRSYPSFPGAARFSAVVGVDVRCIRMQLEIFTGIEDVVKIKVPLEFGTKLLQWYFDFGKETARSPP
jgi:hypothetical protein